MKVIDGPERPLVSLDVDMNALTTRGVYFERRFVCSQCGLTWKESETRFYQGKPFGIPCSCSNDIAQLMRKGRK